MPAVLGCDVQTGQSVSIGDIERRSGLYVLGKSGMGKSSLLVNILLSDITSGYGVFFIDPHGDAIRDLDQRLQYSPIILDPQHEDTVFGINLLACKNIQSFSDRTNTYIRAYNIFHKLWKEQWGPWMQLIMQHALYVFIENQDYTLAELPLFLRNPEFRTYLLHNVTYAMDSVDFWRYEYQEKQSEAVRTRINTFLGHPHVKHIVGQQATSINFQEIMGTGQVVCVRLLAGLPEDIKSLSQ